LPPVEPPSAAFIVQLFVVPAVIVAAVIGVYLLFGRLAASDVDWRELVVDLRSTNPHTRWRGAHGLAQLLEADALRTRQSASKPDEPKPESSEPNAVAAPVPIARDPELARELAATLSQELDRPEESEEQQRLVEYLIKSVGWMDVPAEVLPTLRRGLESGQDDWVIQQSLIAIGMVCGRASERGTAVDDAALVDDLLRIVAERTGVLRHLATYDLGFLANPEAQSRLSALLGDEDPLTRINAAVGLARQGSSAALSIFEGVLRDAGGQTFDPSQVGEEAAAYAYFERVQQVTNSLAAVATLKEQLTDEQRQQYAGWIEPLTNVPDVELRHKAIETLYILRGSSP
jgi:hypothetical protein